MVTFFLLMEMRLFLSFKHATSKCYHSV